MRRSSSFCLAVVVILFLIAPQLHAFGDHGKRPKGHVMTPQSSVPQPGEEGVKLRTHLKIFVPATGFLGKAVQPDELPPFPGLLFETPASLGCVYHLVRHPIPGCNPNLTTENPSGGSGAIALVEAFDDTTVASDLDAFSAQFGLPPADVTVVFAQGQPAPDTDGGFVLETALDTQWAHAMAPGAKLFVVEAADNTVANLLGATALASQLVAGSGGGEVSISFGTGEFPEETFLDPIFSTQNVIYLASSGDGPGVQWPSASPNVISAGGTTISRDTDTGNFILENTWQVGGGGASEVEPRPSFQNGIRRIVGGARGTPDISFDADPITGVWVFNQNPVFGEGWFILGGTSLSSPALAGIINAAGGGRASSQAENAVLYSNIGQESVLRDITYGNCGLSVSDFSQKGWDFCTGVGSPLGLRGK